MICGFIDNKQRIMVETFPRTTILHFSQLNHNHEMLIQLSLNEQTTLRLEASVGPNLLMAIKTNPNARVPSQRGEDTSPASLSC